MQRSVTVLLVGVLAGFVLTGCPEKKIEKEEPREPSAADKSGADEKNSAEDEHAEEQADDRAEDPKDDKKPVKKKKAEKPAAEEKDQGGW